MAKAFPIQAHCAKAILNLNILALMNAFVLNFDALSVVEIIKMFVIFAIIEVG